MKSKMEEVRNWKKMEGLRRIEAGQRKGETREREKWLGGAGKGRKREETETDVEEDG